MLGGMKKRMRGDGRAVGTEGGAVTSRDTAVMECGRPPGPVLLGCGGRREEELRESETSTVVSRKEFVRRRSASS